MALKILENFVFKNDQLEVKKIRHESLALISNFRFFHIFFVYFSKIPFETLNSIPYRVGIDQKIFSDLP